MKKVIINYRTKLSVDFVFSDPLTTLLEGKYPLKDIDLQIIAEDGTLIEDFCNSNLLAANSFEGGVVVYFKDNVKDKNLKRRFFDGVIYIDYKAEILNSSKIFNYCLYESFNNTFYCTRADLQPFSEDFSSEVLEIWNSYIDFYALAYGQITNVDIVGISISEDGKVCKLKTRGFYHLDNNLDNDSLKLNRNIPS